ncbi:MAG: carboxypeptidase M32 [Planctomycetota bacterium]
MQTDPSTTYQQLCDHVRETALLRSTLALLEWDQHTKLPTSANQYRSNQITCLSGLVHQRSVDPHKGEWIEQLSSAEDQLSGEQSATVRELKRDFDRATKLPGSLVEELARAASEGQTCWVEARKQNDFASFAPQLKKIVSLKRQQADAIGFANERYDALLDEYEPGATTEEVATVLNDLCAELVPLVSAIQESKQQPETSILKRHFPTSEQQAFGREVSAAIGFDYERGRLDVTHHPFCTELGPDDCRITTRYNESFFNSSLFGTLHEAGHGIYEQGLRSDQYGLPLGSYCSLGIHESQSRLWENLVGRSLPFWKHFFPQAQTRFSEAFGDVSLDQFYAAINAVKPSLIRVEADEATYNLHIIIRFELERAMMNEDLNVEDLPAAWNQKYRDYLGVDPPTDAHGVLQDVHWSAGLFGYFPTYSLGNLYASQLFDAAEAELGKLGKLFEQGQFEPLKVWLNENVHQPGKRFSGPELAKQITGNDLGHEALMRHLKSKYGGIYGSV